MTSRPEPSVAKPLPNSPIASRTDLEHRYARHLRLIRSAPAELGDAIVRNMGFCHAHEAYISGLDHASKALVGLAKALADARLRDMLARAGFHDPAIQDIVFGARLRCPVCAYLRRLEMRGVSLLLRDVDRGRLTPARLVGAMPTLEAAYRASLHVSPPLRAAFVTALRRRAKKLVERAAAVDEGIRPDRSRAALANAISSASEPTDTGEAETCPICRAIRAASDRWLRSVRENIRLDQPLWLTFPGCPAHTRQALVALSDIPARLLVAHFVDAYLGGGALSEPVRSGASTPGRRRKSASWFDPCRSASEAAGSHAAPHAAWCPACHAEDVALRRSVAALVKAAMKAGEPLDTPRLDACCAKHFAEALIVAPGDVAQHWLQQRLRTAGVFQARPGAGRLGHGTWAVSPDSR